MCVKFVMHLTYSEDFGVYWKCTHNENDEPGLAFNFHVFLCLSYLIIGLIITIGHEKGDRVVFYVDDAYSFRSSSILFLCLHVTTFFLRGIYY